MASNPYSSPRAVKTVRPRRKRVFGFGVRQFLAALASFGIAAALQTGFYLVSALAGLLPPGFFMIVFLPGSLLFMCANKVFLPEKPADLMAIMIVYGPATAIALYSLLIAALTLWFRSRSRA